MASAQSLYLQLFFRETLLASATGFVARSPGGPVLVTARHNVTGRRQDDDTPISKTGGTPDRVLIIHHHSPEPLVWTSRFEDLYDLEGRPRWIEHPRLGRIADVVALPLVHTDVTMHPHEVINAQRGIDIGPADPVSVVGFPFGLQSGGSLAVWATGFVASEPDYDHDGLPVFLIDCRSRPGQSGSPVIARRTGAVPTSRGLRMLRQSHSELTEFLGVYSGRINEQSDLGTVWKTTAVADLVRSIGQSRDLAAGSRLTTEP